MGFFEKLFGSGPESAQAHLDRGITHFEKGQYDAAIAAWNEAVAIKSDYADAYNNMGVAYDRLGQHTEAIAAYEKAIALRPDCAEAYGNRAIAHYSKRNYDKAWADVNACQRLGEEVHPEFLAELRKASGREE